VARGPAQPCAARQHGHEPQRDDGARRSWATHPSCRRSCSTIDSVIVNPDYAGSTNDDWAVLKVPTWLTTNVTPTGLSQLNQDTHIQHDAFRRGYPWMAATFSDTSGFCFDFEYPVETGCPSDWVPCQGMFHQTGEVTGFTTNRINTKLDSSDGDSGSSFQYLPATPKVTGLNVAKYHLAGGWRAGGPKVEVFRTFVQSQY
jgi:hypothetical protein